jgi:AcrR family transcriptional regulator
MASQLSRRDRRKLEVRTRIIEAAMVLFDEEGFRKTKVAAICARADVAHKTFFNHFASKHHLLREIAGHALEQLLGDIRSVCDTPGSTRARLERFFERVVDNADAAGPMHRELVAEIIHVAHDSGTEPEQARKLHDAFATLVHRGGAARELTARHDPETMIEMIMGAFYVLMFNWANLDGYPLRRQARAAARFLGDALTVEPSTT